jgi:hypothetical protein
MLRSSLERIIEVSLNKDNKSKEGRKEKAGTKRTTPCAPSSGPHRQALEVGEFRNMRRIKAYRNGALMFR